MLTSDIVILWVEWVNMIACNFELSGETDGSMQGGRTREAFDRLRATAWRKQCGAIPLGLNLNHGHDLP